MRLNLPAHGLCLISLMYFQGEGGKFDNCFSFLRYIFAKAYADI